MCWVGGFLNVMLYGAMLDQCLGDSAIKGEERGAEIIDLTPAWSLSALLSLLPKEIKVDENPYDEVQEYELLIYPFMGGWRVDYQYCEDDECHCLKCVYSTDLIEACVKAIEWLTANGYKLNGIEKGGEK